MEIAIVTVATVNDAPANPNGSSEELLRARVDQLTAQNRVLELKVQKLQRRLWDKKSERMPKGDKQGVFFDEPERTDVAATPATRKSIGAPRTPTRPKPLDRSLPREVIQVPAPDLKDLICPVTKQPMRPGFVERIEVLARRAPVKSGVPNGGRSFARSRPLKSNSSSATVSSTVFCPGCGQLLNVSSCSRFPRTHMPRRRTRRS